MDPPAHIHSAKFGNNNPGSGNISDSFNTYIFNPSDEKSELLQWLSPLEPRKRHLGVRAGLHPGVGSWLLETNEFREWRGGDKPTDKAVCFCSGDPGVGKPHLRYMVGPFE